MKETDTNRFSQQVNNDFRIVYDMQTGDYYKVHKQLGTEVRVYKDGSEIKKFKPELTGQFISRNK